MRLFAFILVIACSALIAQEAEPSLADAAKKKGDGKPKSKVVITEENLPAHGPLPSMNLEGVDNSDEVLKSIDQYRQTHTTAEIEQIVRDWYDEYYTLFVKAFTDSEEIKSRAQDRSYTPRRYSDDAGKYQEQRLAEVHSAVQDQRLVTKNNLLMARIQQSFQKVRNGLQARSIKYDWMKIRFGNGNGSW
jgi:hypothetical protein